MKIYVPFSIRGIRNTKYVFYFNKLVELHANVFSIGELQHIKQSMAVKTDKGLVLFVGCSLPKMKKILEAAFQLG